VLLRCSAFHFDVNASEYSVILVLGYVAVSSHVTAVCSCWFVPGVSVERSLAAGGQFGRNM
jgi:hypothetical protein